MLFVLSSTVLWLLKRDLKLNYTTSTTNTTARTRRYDSNRNNFSNFKSISLPILSYIMQKIND